MNLNCRLLSFLGGIIVFSVLACEKKTDCSVYANETYIEKKVDSAMLSTALKGRDELLRRFDETPIRTSDHPCYHLLYYSQFGGYGRSIKVEQKDGRFFLTVKCVSTDGRYPNCENNELEILAEEWYELENIMTDFSFWKAEALDDHIDPLDSSLYILEGIRPDAAYCDKKSYQFVARHHVGYDNIDALCMRIVQYEEAIIKQRKAW